MTVNPNDWILYNHSHLCPKGKIPRIPDTLTATYADNVRHHFNLLDIKYLALQFQLINYNDRPTRATICDPIWGTIITVNLISFVLDPL